MSRRRLLVAGGGAAGFFCAVNAARLNPLLDVIILEKTGKVLSKVKVSGGGRCNVTHYCNDISQMIRSYPRGGNFLKKAFYRFFTQDTMQWFADRGVNLKTEADGRVFPVSDSSQTVIDCLLAEMKKYKVELRLHSDVRGCSFSGGKWKVELQSGEQMEADYLCIACGGFSKMTSYQWIQNLGHSIEPPLPSLFTFNMPGHPITALMGISVPEVQVKITGSRLQEKGAILITHWGLSGPVILRLSAWAAAFLASRQYAFHIIINWLPSYNEQTVGDYLLELREARAAQLVMQKNPFGLPQRLWQFLVSQAGVNEETRWGNMTAKARHLLGKHLCNHECEIHGKTTFKEEFVTAGGIKLSEIEPQTMASRVVPQLYFAGEIMDVDGITGGFNFQHAWTSGWIAATAIAGATRP